MSKIEILGTHHIQLAMPVGEEGAARDFYCSRLGLQEVEKPQELAGRGGVWFDGQGVRLHLGVEPDFRAAKKAHPAFRVANLDISFKALSDIATSEISTLPGIKRFYITDPFGNRIEILETT